MPAMIYKTVHPAHRMGDTVRLRDGRAGEVVRMLDGNDWPSCYGGEYILYTARYAVSVDGATVWGLTDRDLDEEAPR